MLDQLRTLLTSGWAHLLHLLGVNLGQVVKNEALVTGFTGLLSMNDERAFVTLVRELGWEKAKVIGDFYHWQFPRTTYEERLVAMYYTNRLRSLIVKMTKEDARGFLRNMVFIISKGGGGEEGFRKVREHLLDLGVPLPPDNATDALVEARAWFAGLPAEGRRLLGEAREFATQSLERMATSIETSVEEKRRNRGFWAKLSDKL